MHYTAQFWQGRISFFISYLLLFYLISFYLFMFCIVWCITRPILAKSHLVLPFLSFIFLSFIPFILFMFCLMHYAANSGKVKSLSFFLYFSFPPWLGWFGRLVFVLCTIVEIWQGRISLFLHYVTILAFVFEKWFNPSNILIILQFFFFWFSFLLYKFHVRYAVMTGLAGLVYVLFSTPKSLPICKSIVCPVCLFWSLADVALLAEFADWSLSGAP